MPRWVEAREQAHADGPLRHRVAVKLLCRLIDSIDAKEQRCRDSCTCTTRRSGSWPAQSACPETGPSTCRPAEAAGPRALPWKRSRVALLADRLEQLLDEVVRRTGGTAAVPAVAPCRAG